MQELGYIISIEDSSAKIKISKGSSCGGCAACHPTGDGGYEVKTKNTQNFSLKIGDTVKIDIPEQKQKLTSVLLYSIPILSILMGLALGNLLSLPLAKEPASALLTVILFVLSLWLVRILYKINENKILPTIVEKVTNFESPKLQQLRKEYKLNKQKQ